MNYACNTLALNSVRMLCVSRPGEVDEHNAVNRGMLSGGVFLPASPRAV
jgi:hypothetical protein